MKNPSVLLGLLTAFAASSALAAVSEQGAKKARG